jgi:hypothetical protein
MNTSTHIIETKPSPDQIKNFIIEAEALRNKADALNIPMVIGIDEEDNTYITANTPVWTSDNLFLLVTGLAPRQHPSLLTLAQLDDIVHRIEEDTEDLRALNVPFVTGIQPTPHGKLHILSHMPPETRKPIVSAHFDLTIDPDMLGDTEEVPCP